MPYIPLAYLIPLVIYGPWYKSITATYITLIELA